MFAATCKNPVKGARSARQAGAEPQRPGSKRERREIIMAAKRPDFPAECAWQESSLRKVPRHPSVVVLRRRGRGAVQADSQTGLGAADG